MIDVSKIKELEKLCQSLEIISVYDTCCYSYEEMLYMLKAKINELVLKYNCDKDSLIKLVDDLFNKLDNLQKDVKLNVADILLQMLEDGTLTQIINEEIFGYIMARLKELTDLVNTFDTRIKTLETKIEEYYNTLNTKIDDTKTSLTNKINNNHTEINNKVDGIQQDLQTQIDNIEVGGGGDVDLTPALNNKNFAMGLQGGKEYLEDLECTVWFYKIPKSNGVLKQGFSKYYKTNPLNHEPDMTMNKYDICDDISIDYNATVCITGSPNKADGTGFMGVNITNNEVRCNKTDGWFTCGIDSSNSLKFFMPDVSADVIKSQGIQNAFDTMQPLVINGTIPPSEIINKWGYASFYEDKHPRVVFGEDKKGNWVFMTVHGRTKGQKGCTYASLASVLIDKYSLKNATAMDGGGSTELVINHSKVNWNIENYGADRRKRPHTLCFVLQDAPTNDNQKQANDTAKLVSQLSDRVIRGESQRGVFNEYIMAHGVVDPNTIRRSGIYWVKHDTPNAPGGISYGILHFEVEPGARMQYAFPYADNGYKIMMRRLVTETGQWGSWVYPEGNS